VLIENRSSEAALLGAAAAEMTGNESINEKAHGFANQYAETVRDVIAAIPLPLAAASRMESVIQRVCVRARLRVDVTHIDVVAWCGNTVIPR